MLFGQATRTASIMRPGPPTLIMTMGDSQTALFGLKIWLAYLVLNCMIMLSVGVSRCILSCSCNGINYNANSLSYQ
jgi:hypothetical protein